MIPTALTEVEAWTLNELARGKTVLEVGALLGHSTVVMAHSAMVVHSIDPHEGYPVHDPKPTLKPFLKNLKKRKVRDKVVVHLGRDYEVMPVLESRQFHLIFIDMSGLYEDTRRAMEASTRLLRHHGTLVVHDCGHPEWPGVQRAVKDFALQHKSPYRMIDRMAIFQQTWDGVYGEMSRAGNVYVQSGRRGKLSVAA